jgi:hypothetical protein
MTVYLLLMVRMTSNGYSLVMRHARLSDRLTAKARAFTLDRQLAGGASPESSVPLSLRARALTDHSTREQLAQQLRRVIRYADDPPPLGARAPIRRSEVSEAEPELRLLASRLQAPTSVEVRGVAQARVLIGDGCGPLYSPSGAGGLRAAAREATQALS